MKTTLDLPEDALLEAMSFSGERTQQGAIVKVLNEYNRRNKLDQLLKRIGRSETFMDSKELMSLRAQEIIH